MLALVAIAAGVLLGYASGGSLRRLIDVRLPYERLILALFIAQAFARSPLAAFLGDATTPIWGACSIALFVVSMRAVSRPGIGLIAAGVAANGLVILSNGAMPIVAPMRDQVELNRALDASHGFYVIADRGTILPVLGDVLPASIGYASLGDVLLAVGLCAFLVKSMTAED